MAVKTVKARWVAPYEAELPGVPVLIPGETVVELPKEEAEASDNWEIVKGKAASKKDDETPEYTPPEPVEPETDEGADS